MLGKNMLSMSGLSLYRNAVQFGMNIAITAFVAPAEYGLVVFTTPFVVLIAMLTDLGLTSAVTRAQHLGRDKAGAAFSATIALGMVLAVCMAAASQPLEHALSMAGLSRVMTGMSLAVVLSITASMPRALLERRLAYARIAAIEAGAVLVGAVLGMVAAWRGAGAFSLVIYNIVNHALRAASFAYLSKSDMTLNLGWRKLGDLLSFGSWVLATNLLSFLQRNSDNLLIGSFLGASAVGIYGLAYQFMLAPVMAITWPTSAILLATLRNVDLKEKHAQRTISAVLAVTGMLSIPVMSFLAFGLAWPVRALLSPRWAEVAQVVAWLAPLGALQSIASYNGAVLMVAGRPRTQFAYTIANTLLLVGTFVLALPFGLMVFVKSYVAMSTLLSFVYLWIIVRAANLGWRGLLDALAPALVATVAGLAIVALLFGYRFSNWPAWIGATFIYGTVVLGIYAMLAARVRADVATLLSPSPA